MSASLTRGSPESTSGSEAEKRAEQDGAMSALQNRVKVELKFNQSDKYDDDDDLEKEHEYVDMADVEKCADLEFMNYGYEGYYSCTRNGTARVSLDGVNIGEITFTIIDREPISYGLYPPMAVVCDEASDLFDVAFHHFKDNGRLKSTLNKKLTDDANQGFFVYISTIELRPPYDRTATEENVAIAAMAIYKFMDSRAFCNLDSGVLVTLFM
jgi:hypothetical protein